MKNNQYGSPGQKTRAHRDLVPVVGGFLPSFFQVSFELLNSLIKRSIITETFRLEQILWPRFIVSKMMLTRSQRKRRVLATLVWSPLLCAPSGSSSIAGHSPFEQAARNVATFINGYTVKYTRRRHLFEACFSRQLL
jgi:hypothetical protein